jgi:tetraacyldisaccharide 4'-kinase
MMIKTPAFWGREGSWFGVGLAPLGEIYGWATAQRLRHGSYAQAGAPVICVGNVTAGGTGKTPVVQALAARLTKAGNDVHIISRGYGGHQTGPIRVDPVRHDATEVGDEPLLLAEQYKVWVARDRAAGAREAVTAGARALILDDGLQNPDLGKDLSFLVVDGLYGFGNGYMIPAGPLREPVEVALTRVSAVIMIGPDQRKAGRFFPSSLPLISARISAKTQKPAAGSRVIGFAGIGRPEKFRQTLIDIGARVAGFYAFPDHYLYNTRDLDRLARAADRAKARLLTTQKDFVRLPLYFRERVETVLQDLSFDHAGPLDELLDKALSPKLTGRF